MTGIFIKNKEQRQKAVSVVIGVMLMLSVFFIAAANYQIVIVPQQEETTEVSHYRTVSSQLSEVRTGILSASSIDSASSQKIEMGATYSQDLIFGFIPEIHPTNPAGTIETRNFTERIEVRNAEGVGASSNYWPGVGDPCTEPNHCFNTNSFHYSVDYNQFQDSPEIVYENTILYDKYQNDPANNSDDEYLIHSDQSLIQGRTINLISLSGDLDQSRVSPATIESVPVSAPAQSITITENSTEPVTFIVPTRLPTDVWENRVLNNEIRNASNPDGYISEVRDGPTSNTIEIEMVPGETYNLKLSQVHLTSREETSNVPQTKAAYVAWEGNERITLRENASTEIEAQVRDRYNNPVPGVDTRATARDSNGNCIGDFRSATQSCPGGQQQPGDVTSGGNGELTYYYAAPDVDSDTSISINIQLNDSSMSYSPSLKTPQIQPKIQTTNTRDPVATKPDPQRVTPRLGGTDFPIRPNVEAGYLNTDNTIRVIDFTPTQTSTSFGQTVRTNTIIDNTGWQTQTITINPTSDKQIKSTPQNYQLTLQPGERKRIGFDIQFLENGQHTLALNGLNSKNYNVTPVQNDIVSGTIVNRINKSNLQKSPSVFKDGDSVNEPQETKNIPPIDYNPTTQTYQNTAQGNLYQFENIGQNDNQNTIIEPSPSNNLNIGFSTGFTADNDVYTLVLNYSYQNDTTDYTKINHKNTNGENIDPNSEYHLYNPGANTETQIEYQLTPTETEQLQRSNEFLTTINQISNGNPTLQIDSLNLVSSETTPRYTHPNITLQSNSPTTTKNTAQPNEKITLKVNATNTQKAVGEKRIKLYEKTPRGNWTAIQSKQIWVNPNTTKEIPLIFDKTNPGTYQYKFGTETTPTTQPLTIQITNT